MNINQSITINKTTSYYSWPVIVLAFVFLWPLGIFLTYKRMSQEKAAATKNSQIVKVIAFIQLGLGVIYASILLIDVGTTDGRDALIGLSSIFIGLGIWLLIISKNMKKDGMRYEQYYFLVAHEKQQDLNAIAKIVGVEPQKAFKDLSNMVTSGYFAGKSMYLDNQTIIYEYGTYESNLESEKESATKPMIVQCSSCGANNTIKTNGQLECEYCGTALK